MKGGTDATTKETAREDRRPEHPDQPEAEGGRPPGRRDGPAVAVLAGRATSDGALPEGGDAAGACLILRRMEKKVDDRGNAGPFFAIFCAVNHGGTTWRHLDRVSTSRHPT